jgi:hypothetical protein
MVTAKQNAIACIGWGSLVWDPRSLPCRGIWHSDGPFLPVEFARESADKRITLVICPGVASVRTFWTLLDVTDIASAKAQLATREYAKADAKWIASNIGFWDRSSAGRHDLETNEIATWADSLGLAGVVWTNLPCQFRGQKDVMPTSDEVLSHMRALDDNLRAAAEKYVRMAPAQIDTSYRRRLAQELGWSCIGS